VRFEFNTDPDFIAVCHCLDCKRASGGEAATWFGVPTEDFTVLAGEPKPYHYVADSGGKLDRNFCPNCGWRVHQQPGQLSGSGIRSTWQPRPPRNDYAEAGDVRKTTPSLDEGAGPARVLRHASLVEPTPERLSPAAWLQSGQYVSGEG